MTSFQDLFEEADQHWVTFKNKKVFWADKFPVKQNETLIISIEQTNSKYRQGLSIDIDGTCELGGETLKRDKGLKMLFWEDDFKKRYCLARNAELFLFQHYRPGIPSAFPGY